MTDTRSSLEKAFAAAQASSEHILRQFAEKLAAQWDCAVCGERDNDGDACAACGEAKTEEEV